MSIPPRGTHHPTVGELEFRRRTLSDTDGSRGSWAPRAVCVSAEVGALEMLLDEGDAAARVRRMRELLDPPSTQFRRLGSVEHEAQRDGGCSHSVERPGASPSGCRQESVKLSLRRSLVAMTTGGRAPCRRSGSGSECLRSRGFPSSTDLGAAEDCGVHGAPRNMLGAGRVIRILRTLIGSADRAREGAQLAVTHETSVRAVSGPGQRRRHGVRLTIGRGEARGVAEPHRRAIVATEAPLRASRSLWAPSRRARRSASVG